MTMNQLDAAQLALERAQVDQDISRMLKGVVTNMHLLAMSPERQVSCHILVMRATHVLAI